MELLIATMAATTVALVLRAAHVRDPVASARVRELSPGPVATSNLSREPSLVHWLGSRMPANKVSTSALLAQAGLVKWSPDTFIGWRVALGLAAALVAAMIHASLAILLAPTAFLVGYFLPSFLVKRRITLRRQELNDQLADVADLLAVCTRAGLNVPMALERVSEHTVGVLGHELEILNKEIDVGVPRAEALRSFSNRAGVRRLEDLTRILSNAERFGSRISESLETFASEIRTERRRLAEEQARRAPVKMLFPLVFLILPAFVLLTVVPLLMGTFQRLGF